MARKISIHLTGATLVAISIGFSDSAFASSGGGGLPWESPPQQIQQSITGPVAGFIALAAVAIAGAMLIFGGELNDFAKRLCYVALVGGVLLGATQIVALFGATGTLIGEVTHRHTGEGEPPQPAWLCRKLELTLCGSSPSASLLRYEKPAQAGRRVCGSSS